MADRFRLPILSKAYLYLVGAILILTGVGLWTAFDLALDMVRFSTFLSMAAILIILPLLVWLVVPLRELERAARLLDGGDFSTPLKVTHHRELARLTRSFEGLKEKVLAGVHQKERLLVDISHEMKGPLARIRLAVDLLEEARGSHELLSQIKEEVGRLNGMVCEVLERARMTEAPAIARLPLDLAEIVRRLVDQRQRVAEQSEVVVELDLAAAPVIGDASLLERAIGNLLDNALIYASPGCRVRIATGREDGEAVCRIDDTGIGIPESDLPHIFEPFYRPDLSRTRATGGAGLGLSIAKAAIEAHQGHIRLASREGEGTKVEIRLPASTGVH